MACDPAHTISGRLDGPTEGLGAVALVGRGVAARRGWHWEFCGALQTIDVDIMRVRLQRELQVAQGESQRPHVLRVCAHVPDERLLERRVLLHACMNLSLQCLLAVLANRCERLALLFAVMLEDAPNLLHEIVARFYTLTPNAVVIGTDLAHPLADLIVLGAQFLHEAEEFHSVSVVRSLFRRLIPPQLRDLPRNIGDVSRLALLGNTIPKIASPDRFHLL